jgi:uncharacterized membrane protein HdeD (DUF308 family)
MIHDERPMAFEILTRNWWAVALRGGLAIVFGVVAFLMPLPTILALVWLFGAYALIDGVFSLVSAAKRDRSQPWWALLFEGLIGIAIGALAFVWPGLTTMALVYLIAAWAFLTGIFKIVAAIRLRKDITGEWMLGLSGVLSVSLGILLAVAPAPAAVALVWVVAAYAIVFGILLVALSVRLKRAKSDIGRNHTVRAA